MAKKQSGSQHKWKKCQCCKESPERSEKMKVIRVFLLSVVFVVALSGCATYRWRTDFPPGGSQADYQRDMAYCNDYARTWCATHGTVVVSGSRQDYQWGQRDVNISGNRRCGDQQFDNVRMDCMRMKGYTCTLERVGKQESVQPIREEKVRSAPTDTRSREAKSYFDQGRTYAESGQHDLAISYFSKAIEINPMSAATYWNRGIAYAKTGQHDLAISDFSKAIEIDPTNAKSYFNRGISYFHKREYEKSWGDIKKAQALGYKIPPKFLEDLQKASGRQN
jgi:tetratricopeptide (TPR) repeat protein